MNIFSMIDMQERYRSIVCRGDFFMYENGMGTRKGNGWGGQEEDN